MMMDPQDWNRLVAGWMEGTLDEADQRLLQQACREDPAKEEELAKASLADHRTFRPAAGTSSSGGRAHPCGGEGTAFAR